MSIISNSKISIQKKNIKKVFLKSKKKKVIFEKQIKKNLVVGLGGGGPKIFLYDRSFSPDCQRWSDQNLTSLKQKVVLISGSSRGIGLYCAKKLAKHGAHIILISKTTEFHPKLPGTIYTAKDEVQQMGGKGQVLALPCDLRKQEDVKNAVQKITEKFGKIDILVNNASSIDLSNSLKIGTKKFDLMNAVNTRGTFMLTKYCLPLLLKSAQPFLIDITPPLDMLQNYPFAEKGLPYCISKIGMSMIILGISYEYPQIKCCGLWPKRTVATAAVKNVVGTNDQINRARTCWIVADALYLLVAQYKDQVQGKFYYDEQIVAKKGLDLKKYFMTNQQIQSFKTMFTQNLAPKL